VRVTWQGVPAVFAGREASLAPESGHLPAQAGASPAPRLHEWCCDA
jgi:hypothetical protein